jgi:hypothetical protein
LARFMFEKGLCFELFVNNFFFKKKVYVFGFQIFYQMRSYIYIYIHTHTHINFVDQLGHLFLKYTLEHLMAP